jgi:RimJ/RimL family protein N-acetyltransferase/8-oxo-dGTP pyrophosphatase MutT (NUDIX family)
LAKHTDSELRTESATSAGGVVYRHGEGGLEVVVCGRTGEGIWGLPKGTPEAGEDLTAVATREVREETGLEVAIQEKIGSISYWFVRKEEGVRYHKTVHHYLFVPTGGSTADHDQEYDRVEWVPVEEACRRLSYPNEVEIVRKASEMVGRRPANGAAGTNGATGGIEDEVARGETVVLRNKRIGDAEADYGWRQDPELATYDAAKPINTPFEDYLALYEDDLDNPSPFRHSFAMEDREGHHIGNVMVYNIDNLKYEAEVGITIGDRGYWGHGYGTDALRAFVRHLFANTTLTRLYLKTLDWNTRAQRCFEKAGFVRTGVSRRSNGTFVLMEVRKDGVDRRDGARS